MADAQPRKRRPEFDNKISMGTVINVIGFAVAIGGGWALLTSQADNNTSAIQRVETAVTSAVTSLESDLEDLDDKVDTALVQQRALAMEQQQLEEEHDELEQRVRADRAVTVQVRSEALTERRLQAQRHETLVDALDELKSTIRSTTD